MGMGSLLGGHVRIECDATISENVAIHQFVTVGNDSFIGAHSKITTDVPRYMRMEGNPSVVRGIDGRRLKQRGISGESLAALREAHRLIYVVKMPLEHAATLLDENGYLVPEVLRLLKFLESQHGGRVGVPASDGNDADRLRLRDTRGGKPTEAWTSLLVMVGQAAVNEVGRPGHVVGVLGCEERGDGADVRRLAHPPERDLAE